MWSLNQARPALAAAVAIALAGCFRPLYGPTASGVPVQQSLAAVDVAPVSTSQGQERLAHYVRSELVFDLDGSGTTSQKRYKLTLDAGESVQVTTSDTNTGRANAALLNVSIRYTLTRIDGNQVVTTGLARTTATYFRDPQRFASVRAARDAEIRASKVLADEIKQRLSAIFATAS